MISSVTFGSKNTWTDWKMLPIARPIINPPALKTNIIDIPAANGQIDLMQALIGAPVYKNRTGSLKFRMTDVDSKSVQAKANEIARYLHGIYMNMILSDEPNYYYSGYYEVTECVYQKRGEFADITIRYDVEPYKYSVAATDDEWLWDTFNFDVGIIPQGTIVNAQVAGIDDGGVTFSNIGSLVGAKTVTPQVVISDNATNIQFRVYNSNTNSWATSIYSTGTDQKVSGTLKFTRFSEKLNVKGYGTYSIKFTAGAL